MRVAICVPCFADPKLAFMASLIGLVTHSAPRHAIGTMIRQGHLIEARNWLAEQAQGWDWMLWLDADHTFPPDTLERLLAHGLDVVGCNYPQRKAPHDPTAANHATLVETTEAKAKAGLVEPVGQMGLGVCLMRPALFQKVPPPWFTFTPQPGSNAHMSEDIRLFRLLATMGVKAHVDHALSWEVGHVAETVVSFRA